jgi:RLL motif containing protein 1
MTDAVLQRRLHALGCPFAKNVNCSQPVELQRAVCWLEDSIIRRRDIPDRAPLRRRAFDAALAGYLAELEAPPHVVEASSCVGVSWLVRVALQLAFDDDRIRYNEPVDPWAGRCVPVVAGASTDESLAAVTRNIVMSLGSDHLPFPSTHVALQAVCSLAEARLAGRNSPSSPGDVVMGDVVVEGTAVVEKTLVLDELPLGFSTGDPKLDRIARILRLLYVRELRLLQNRINEAISSMQRITADPKTDSRLGQVGR